MIIRYIHIPKTAGTSIIKLLEDNNIPFLHGEKDSKNRKIKGHGKAIRWKEEESFKFATVRNPYSRIVSYYNFTTTPAWNPTFEEFVYNKMLNEDLNVPNVWVPQTSWILDDDNNIIVDKIFKLEDNFEEKLKEFLKIKTKNFPKKNVSTRDNYEDYFNLKLKEIIFERFQTDFKVLNYKK